MKVGGATLMPFSSLQIVLLFFKLNAISASNYACDCRISPTLGGCFPPVFFKLQKLTLLRVETCGRSPDGPSRLADEWSDLFNRRQAAMIFGATD
jgi:hypothetical protein